MNYSKEDIKKAFWETFHKSGELWFNYLGTDEENESSTESKWEQFLDNLLKTEDVLETKPQEEQHGVGPYGPMV